MEWLRQKWVCVLFLVLFPPLGIYLLWKYQIDWKKSARIGATLASAVWCVVLLGIGFTQSVAPEKITLLGTDIKVDLGETVEVELALVPKNADPSKLVAWISESDVAVVSFKQKGEGVYCCKVQAKQEGDAQLMVYCDKVQSNVVTIHVLNRDQLISQAFAAEQAIAPIGQVTLQSGEAIVIARQAYDALGEDAAALVDNYDDLLAAEQELQRLQDEAWRQAEEAQNKIDAIGEVGLESKDIIAEAREYYDNLPEAVRPLVKNYQELQQAEQILEQKEAEEEASQKPSTPATPKPEPAPSSRPNDSGQIVYWVPNGEKYHTTKNCRTLARSKIINSGTIRQAGGRDLCKVCG